MTLLRLTRKVTPNECEWLKRTFKAGEVVAEFNGATYGCITNEGVACIELKDLDHGAPFFELPWDAVEVAQPAVPQV